MAAVMSPATSNFQQNDVTFHVINMCLQTFVCKSDAAKLLPASISNLLVVVHVIKKKTALLGWRARNALGEKTNKGNYHFK